MSESLEQMKDKLRSIEAAAKDSRKQWEESNRLHLEYFNKFKALHDDQHLYPEQELGGTRKQLLEEISKHIAGKSKECKETNKLNKEALVLSIKIEQINKQLKDDGSNATIVNICK